MPIKSVHLTNYYHKTSGGISTAYNHLLDAANRHKREVALIVPGEETSIEEIGSYGKIYYIKASPSPIFDKRYRLMLPWKTFIFEGSPIKVILREMDPDIIEIGEKYTLSLMAGLIRKHVITITKKRPMLVQFSCERMDDNVRAFLSGGRLSRWLARRYTANYTLPMFDFHLTNSDYTAQEFFDSVSAEKDPHRSKLFFNWCWRYLRAPKLGLRERVFVNQCGVDNTTFDPSRRSAEKRAAFEAEFNIPENGKMILYAGRISPEKNTGLLIDTMAAIPSELKDKCVLLIAGGGPTGDKLRDEAERKMPGKIQMIGHITDKSRLADLFANCDAFIHPNPREPFGITPLEAMASGLPVVAPNSGGLLSYANETNAWLAEPTGEAFAEELQSVFSDPELRESRVEAGVSTAKQYDWDRSTDCLFGLYDQMYATFTENIDLFAYDEPASTFDFPGPLNAT